VYKIEILFKIEIMDQLYILKLKLEKILDQLKVIVLKNKKIM